MKQFVLILLSVGCLQVSIARTIKLNENVVYSGTTQKDEAAGDYPYAFLQEYEYETQTDQKIGLADINKAFACPRGTKSAGPFFTFEKNGKLAVGTDTVADPRVTISNESLRLEATSGTYQVYVSAYSSEPCFRVGGSFSLVEK